MLENEKRNLAIIKLLDTERHSYAVIAEMVETTRNVVAGVAFRHRHPCSTRVCSPGSGGHPNKIGTGWQRRSYYPEKTARNTR